MPGEYALAGMFPGSQDPAGDCMRRFVYVVAAVLALAPMAALAPASAGVAHRASTAAQAATGQVSHDLRPLNDWTNGLDSVWENENWGSSVCARIDDAGALIIGYGDCTLFSWDSSNGEIVDDNVGTPNCLFYDKLGARDGIPNSYDLDYCNANSTSDVWSSASNHTWSEWYTGYNNANGDSMWSDGTGTGNPLYAAAGNGSNPDDRWNAS
jgi:hypothetical protein